MGCSYLIVVDDDPQITSLLRVVLGRSGYEVCASHSGEQALDMARSRPPAAMIVDLWMPGMSGEDVLHQMEAEPDLADVPVIVTTGDTDATEIVGAFATLTKPFEVELLYRTIRAALETRQQTN